MPEGESEDTLKLSASRIEIRWVSANRGLVRTHVVRDVPTVHKNLYQNAYDWVTMTIKSCTLLSFCSLDLKEDTFLFLAAVWTTFQLAVIRGCCYGLVFLCKKSPNYNKNISNVTKLHASSTASSITHLPSCIDCKASSLCTSLSSSLTSPSSNQVFLSSRHICTSSSACTCFC